MKIVQSPSFPFSYRSHNVLYSAATKHAGATRRGEHFSRIGIRGTSGARYPVSTSWSTSIFSFQTPGPVSPSRPKSDCGGRVARGRAEIHFIEPIPTDKGTYSRFAKEKRRVKVASPRRSIYIMSGDASLRERIAAQTIKGTNGYEMRYVCQSSMVISYSYFLSETFPSMTTTTSP